MSAEMQAEHFMVIGIANVKLVIPHREVTSIEPVSQLVTDGATADSVGRTSLQGSELTVYALGNDFSLLTDKEYDDRFIICLRDDDDKFGLLARTALPYSATDSQVMIELPAVMRRADTIISTLTRSDSDELLQFCSAAHIRSHISSQEASSE